MKNEIDCLIIGHNQIEYEKFVNIIKSLGMETSTYRDFNMNFLTYKSKKCNAADIYNELCVKTNPQLQKINYIETFSAAIAYLATYLNNRGFSYEFINSFQDEKEKLISLLQSFDIKTIAISTTLYVIPTPIFEILEFLKIYNRGSKIIIGGPFIATQIRNSSSEEQQNLFNQLDADYYVNSSQGEKALVDLLTMIKNEGIEISSIDNVIYKSDNKYIFTNSSEERNKLSENIVNWGLVSDRAGDFINIRTSISCPFSCSFCGFPEHAGKYQTIEISDIEKELNTLKTLPDLKNVFFLDDTFNVPQKRFKEILRMLLNRNHKITWHSFIRAQYIDDEIASLMKESGCVSVFLGLESGNDTILKNMNKRVTVNEYQRGIEILSKKGIQTYGSFLIGFPGETEKTFYDTFRFIENSGLDYYRAQLWYYEYISPIWRERDRYNIQGKGFEWSHSTLNSKNAYEMIEKMIIEIDEPVRVPQYYFDYEFLVQMQYRGMTSEQIKQFLKGFNEGIREKLVDINRMSMSSQTIATIQNAGLTGVNNKEDETEWVVGIQEFEL